MPQQPCGILEPVVMNEKRKPATSPDLNGLLGTTLNLLAYPLRKINKSVTRAVLKYSGNEKRFTHIYKTNSWADTESVSGPGSTLEYTKNLRRELPILFDKFSISSVFDAPCGDFNWMKEVLKTNQIDYIGGDIVKPLIKNHNQNYNNANTKFLHFDITKDIFPKVDLWICRDCLFHLSFEDTKAALQQFVASNIPYILTTTHTDTVRFTNKNIRTGSCRLIDLFSTPYNFPDAVLFRIEDWITPFDRREMCLWSRDQVIAALERFGA
jgi:hypothetical protein